MGDLLFLPARCGDCDDRGQVVSKEAAPKLMGFLDALFGAESVELYVQCPTCWGHRTLPPGHPKSAHAMRKAAK